MLKVQNQNFRSMNFKSNLHIFYITKCIVFLAIQKINKAYCERAHKRIPLFHIGLHITKKPASYWLLYYKKNYSL